MNTKLRGIFRQSTIIVEIILVLGKSGIKITLEI